MADKDTTELVEGGFAIFNGYAQPPEGGVEKLKKGDAVKIRTIDTKEDNIVVVKVDENGDEINGEDGKAIAESCFPEELTAAEVVPDEEVAEASEDASAGDEANAETDTDGEVVEEETKPKGRARKPAAAKKADEKPKAEAKEKAKPAAKKAAAKKAAADKDKAASEKKEEVKTTEIVEIKDAVSVTNVIEAEGDALKAAKALVERREATDYTLGGVLRNIRESGAFKTLGYDGKRGFEEYVEETLGIASRKAYYLITIYTTFAMVGVDEARLQAIGWSKAKELARVGADDLKKDLNKLLKLAESSSRDKLVEHIKDKYDTVQSRQQSVKMTSFSFKLAEAEADTVKEGLKEAATLIGEDDPSKAFAYIVGEWRNTGTGQDLDLEQSLELIAAKFSLQSITFVDEGGEPNEFVPEGAEEQEAETETA